VDPPNLARKSRLDQALTLRLIKNGGTLNYAVSGNFPGRRSTPFKFAAIADGVDIIVRTTSRKAVVPPISRTRTGQVARHQRRLDAMHAPSQENNPA
jgi:hypothetical protein